MNIDAPIAKIPTMSDAQRKTMRANAIEKLASGDPKWADAATKTLAALDAQVLHEEKEQVETAQGLPKAQRVAYAFTRMPPTPTQERIIRVLLDHPGCTNAELSRKLGWKDNGWDLHFGSMCADRMHLLWRAEPAVTRPGLFYSGILARYESEGSVFVMHPEAVEGFEAIGIRAARQ
jgi:hypothetical protein